MRNKTQIVILYSVFAGISTIANLGVQFVFVKFFEGPWVITVSILLGTAVGLPIKYVLDKKYIFRFTSRSVLHDTQLFILYSAMAVVTTAIFWGTELLFQLAFGTELLRLTGGAIGLVIGYFIKYQLDKRFVFSPAEKGFHLDGNI